MREAIKGGNQGRQSREVIKGGIQGRHSREVIKGGIQGRRSREVIKGGIQGRPLAKPLVKPSGPLAKPLVKPSGPLAKPIRVVIRVAFSEAIAGNTPRPKRLANAAASNAASPKKPSARPVNVSVNVKGSV